MRKRDVRALTRLLLLLPLLAACLTSPGCHHDAPPTTRPVGIRERQDEALRDPFGYDNKDIPTVTGEKEGGFDNQGFRRDLQRVFNP
jgi:hypothetical protein